MYKILMNVLYRFTVQAFCSVIIMDRYVERGSSEVERQTRNRGRARIEISFAIVSKFGQFRSLHDAQVHSTV